MSFFSKIARVLLFPKELALRAMVAEHDREVQKSVKKAAKIMEDFKREVSEDTEVEKFLAYYDKKYTLKRY